MCFGDADGDGSVTGVDTVVLARYLADWSSVQSIVATKNSDLNDDGRITAIDVVILARHLSNWKGYDILPAIFK